MKIYIYIIFIICITFNITNATEVEFEKSTITIQTKNSEYIFNVEIAKTAEERSKGLMHREHLNQKEGMLFLYPYSKGMKVPLAPSIEPRSARAQLTSNNRFQNSLDDDQTSQHRRCVKYTDTLKNCRYITSSHGLNNIAMNVGKPRYWDDDSLISQRKLE